MRYRHETVHSSRNEQIKLDNVIDDTIDLGAHTGNKLQLTQKLLSILVPLIHAFSRPGARVLDPSMGSCSTLAAGMMCDRPCTGRELEWGNCEIAQERLTRIAQSSARVVDDLG